MTRASGRLCFVKPSERDQWPDQDDVVDAVTRIGLDGPVSRLRRLMRLPQQEMSERLRAERRERPGIERREPHRALAPLDRWLRFGRPAMDHASKNEAKCGRRAECKRRIECDEGGSTIMRVHAEREAGESKRQRIVATMFQRKPRVSHRLCAILSPSALRAESDYDGPSRLGRARVRKPDQAQERASAAAARPRAIGHAGIDVRLRAQHELVGVETIRPLAFDAFDLRRRVSSARWR